MVPQDLTNWKAPHVTDPASAVRSLLSHASIALRSVSHRLVGESVFCFSPLSPSPTLCLIFFSLSPFCLYLLPHSYHSYLFSSVLLSPPPLHSVVKHWLLSHVLLHTSTNPRRQVMPGYSTAEQHTNSVTLRDVGTTRQHTNTHRHTITHTHKQAWFLFSLNLHTNLNLPQLIWVHHTDMSCLPFANKQSSIQREERDFA